MPIAMTVIAVFALITLGVILWEIVTGKTGPELTSEEEKDWFHAIK